MDIGSVVIGSEINGTGGLYGQLRAIYGAGSSWAAQPTRWNIDGGSWRDVGSAAANVYSGQHVVQFYCLNGDDTPPGTKNPSVSAGKLRNLTVTFTP